jgi:trans-2,3-dihydro-3-hydroxyanthranilate isomerase
MNYPYRVVDVFTQTPLEGNALAVFPEAQGLDSSTMQKIALELNLAETVFILPAERPESLATLRIFTPTREMVFAGHPTIGASYVLLPRARGDNFQLDLKVGPVTVRVEAGASPRLWLTTPPISQGRNYSRILCAQALGIDDMDLLTSAPQVVSAGNPCLFIAVKDKATVDRASLGLPQYRKLVRAGDEALCIFVFTPTASGAYSRMFAPEHGVQEDPATGSATGPLAWYMRHHGLTTATHFHSEQGTKMGRRSLLYVAIDGDRIEVGGHVTPLVEAVMSLG